MRHGAVAILASMALLSGCLGGGQPASDPGDEATRVIAPSSSPSAPLPTVGVEEPKYHPHDLWGDRASVEIFGGTITLGSDPRGETSYAGDGGIVEGYREFDTRADGDDSTSVDKADVVYQGTNAIVVKVEWSTDKTQAQIPGLTFLYKAANSARFTAIQNVPNGQDVVIPLQRGMADMPHQLKLTRWRFALEAFDPQFAAHPAKVHVARGDAKVTMTALNGGEKWIDEPHPYNFLTAKELPAGEIQRTLDVTVVSSDQTGTTSVHGEPVTGWQVPAPFFVPWETTTLKVTMKYTYTGPATGVPHELALRYTDASGPEVKTPTPVRTAPGEVDYEILVLSTQADDPYAKKSDWTWGVHPIVGGLGVGGDFKGDVTITLVAIGSDEVPA